VFSIDDNNQSEFIKKAEDALNKSTFESNFPLYRIKIQLKFEDPSEYYKYFKMTGTSMERIESLRSKFTVFIKFKQPSVNPSSNYLLTKPDGLCWYRFHYQMQFSNDNINLKKDPNLSDATERKLFIKYLRNHQQYFINMTKHRKVFDGVKSDVKSDDLILSGIEDFIDKRYILMSK